MPVASNMLHCGTLSFCIVKVLQCPCPGRKLQKCKVQVKLTASYQQACKAYRQEGAGMCAGNMTSLDRGLLAMQRLKGPGTNLPVCRLAGLQTSESPADGNSNAWGFMCWDPPRRWWGPNRETPASWPSRGESGTLAAALGMVGSSRGGRQHGDSPGCSPVCCWCRLGRPSLKILQRAKLTSVTLCWYSCLSNAQSPSGSPQAIHDYRHIRSKVAFHLASSLH